jgi:hypothetical protein
VSARPLSFAWLIWGLVAAASMLWPQDALADRRLALVIGNGAYRNAPRLPNPSSDAQDVSAALKRTGFEVILGIDLDKAAMDEAQIRFARAARDADVALFYYSGHAMQMNGINYLMPVDAKLTDEADLRRMARVDDIVADLQQAKNLRILVLDSCRDNPLAEELKRSIGRTRALGIQRGLAKIDNPQGMIVSYATQAGRTAEDGSGRNSPYTTAFLKNIEQPEEIGTVFRRVGADVFAATRQTQLPELSLSLIGEYYLKGRSAAGGAPPSPVPAPTPLPADPCALAEAHWRSAEAIGTHGAYEDHLARFANCAFAGLARAKIAALQRPAPPPPAPQPMPQPPPVAASEFLFPDSDRRYLSRAELSRLSTAQLRLARNEIYARKGRYFRDQQLAAYFSRFPWYKPFAWDVQLNAVEQANVRLIQSLER